MNNQFFARPTAARGRSCFFRAGLKKERGWARTTQPRSRIFSQATRLGALALLCLTVMGCFSLQAQLVTNCPVEVAGPLSNPLMRFRPGLNDSKTNTFATANADGLKLFDAAVSWAIGQAAVAPSWVQAPVLSGGELQLEWVGGTLQTTTNVAGPWSEVPGATSPFLATTTNPAKFFA